MTARPYCTVHNRLAAVAQLAEVMQAAADDALTPDAGDGQASFIVGVSGGSAVSIIADAVTKVTSDLSRWRLILCDERLVDENNPDSTYGAFKRTLLAKNDTLDTNFIKPMFTEPNENVAATDYEQQLRNLFPPGSRWPKFHLLILGVGEDGHTASLFPGHALLKEGERWVAPISDSPKPPPRRITLTMPAINSSQRCVFVALGEGKADIMKRMLVDKEELPAFMVNPPRGEVIWILDEAAASKLPGNH